MAGHFRLRGELFQSAGIKTRPMLTIWGDHHWGRSVPQVLRPLEVGLIEIRLEEVHPQGLQLARRGRALHATRAFRQHFYHSKDLIFIGN